MEPNQAIPHPELSSVRSGVSMPSTLMSPPEKGAATRKESAAKPGPTVTSASGEETKMPLSLVAGRLTCNQACMHANPVRLYCVVSLFQDD